ncbi:hypothetical protein SAMN06295912_13625 [Sphingomonas laterariae]|uniref:Uncharacterized protein n=1 Tax=Edaphosphingomonas laterariae TaxID=861865 RepID=A0A239JPC4_9SPHN|nr:hypothetical protein [Sphingomonas laterariae]SNT07268.1 hypothetical protein SAMN06295912_13625 [Sphingomonas laterariae]
MSDFLLQARHQSVTRQHVFLQGAAGAAIAFAIHETADRTLEWSLGIIAIAVYAWAVSFVGGVLFSQAEQAVFAANMAMNDAKRREDKESISKASLDFSAYNKTAARYYKFQLWGLFVGAVLYVCGHGVHIAENSYRKSESAIEFLNINTGLSSIKAEHPAPEGARKETEVSATEIGAIKPTPAPSPGTPLAPHPLPQSRTP